jgi:hypothetical protein
MRSTFAVQQAPYTEHTNPWGLCTFALNSFIEQHLMYMKVYKNISSVKFVYEIYKWPVFDEPYDNFTRISPSSLSSVVKSL